MNEKRTRLTVFLTVTLVLSAVAPAVAATETDLNVGVEQTDATVVVEVTNNSSAVENATVTVETVDENGTYAGEGSYATDENGTVSLDAPAGNESVNVSVAASWNDATVTVTAELAPVEDADDEDGEEFDSFGQRVSAFVHALLEGDTDGPLGQVISEFVTENNPGAEKKSGDAGPPEDAGKPDHAGGPGDDDDDEDDEDGDGGPGKGNGHGNDK